MSGPPIRDDLDDFAVRRCPPDGCIVFSAQWPVFCSDAPPRYPARRIVILMLDEKMEPAVAKGMLQGSADSLDSAFHLSYNLLLSQMRCPDSTPEALLQRSYKQFQADKALPDLQVTVPQGPLAENDTNRFERPYRRQEDGTKVFPHGLSQASLPADC